jgi:hypothetical protein
MDELQFEGIFGKTEEFESSCQGMLNEYSLYYFGGWK